MGMSRAGAQGRIPDVGPAPPGPVESFPRANGDGTTADRSRHTSR